MLRFSSSTTSKRFIFRSLLLSTCILLLLSLFVLSMRNHFSYSIHFNVYKLKEKQALINFACKKDRWTAIEWLQQWNECVKLNHTAPDKIMIIKFDTWHLIYYWIIKKTVCDDSVCWCVYGSSRHEWTWKNLTKVIWFFSAFFHRHCWNSILKVPIKSSKFSVNISDFIMIFTLECKR